MYGEYIHIDLIALQKIESVLRSSRLVYGKSQSGDQHKRYYKVEDIKEKPQLGYNVTPVGISSKNGTNASVRLKCKKKGGMEA